MHIIHFCFSLKSINFSYLRKGYLYLLPGIALTTSYRWKPEEKKRWEQIRVLWKKWWKSTTCLLAPLKTLDSLGAMTVEWYTWSSTQFFYAHIKDWRAKISLYRSLYTYKFLELKTWAKCFKMHVTGGSYL